MNYSSISVRLSYINTNAERNEGVWQAGCEWAVWYLHARVWHTCVRVFVYAGAHEIPCQHHLSENPQCPGRLMSVLIWVTAKWQAEWAAGAAGFQSRTMCLWRLSAPAGELDLLPESRRQRRQRRWVTLDRAPISGECRPRRGVRRSALWYANFWNGGRRLSCNEAEGSVAKLFHACLENHGGVSQTWQTAWGGTVARSRIRLAGGRWTVKRDRCCRTLQK